MNVTKFKSRLKAFILKRLFWRETKLAAKTGKAIHLLRAGDYLHRSHQLMSADK